MEGVTIWRHKSYRGWPSGLQSILPRRARTNATVRQTAGLVIVPGERAVAADMSEHSHAETEALVQQAVAAVEVRSSKFDPFVYDVPIELWPEGTTLEQMLLMIDSF